MPSAFACVLFQFLEILNLTFAGHMGDETLLGGIGLGNMTVNLFAISFIESMNSVVETMGSQAAGNGNLPLAGIILNRGRVLLMYAFVPISLILLNIQWIYLWAGQDEAIVAKMQTYMCFVVPGLAFYAIGDLQKRFLNSMGISRLPMMCSLIALFLHGGWVWLFAVYMDLGVTGFGLAVSMSNAITCVLMLILTNYEKTIEEAIFLPGEESFYGLGEYIKIAIPSTIMTCMDWWSFEIMIFTSGYFGRTAQAAQILLMNIMMFIHKFGEGMSMTAPALVGYKIGYGNIL